ncbi:MAG: sugar ABC transporter permease [Actinomycetaceae bacterium]|nr:sugar ABC transporter permease [Actinomycetaceae bacterium]MDY5855154.1 sugar ABC transporter permease [Arcanobacterium sp.]
MKKRKRSGLWPVLFIGPHAVIFILFFMIPAAFGIYISFTRWTLFDTPEWIGLANFTELLFDTNSIYHQQLISGLGATLVFVAIAVPLCIVVPLFLAMLVRQVPRFQKIFQAIFYIPTLFAVSAVMLIWVFLLSLSYGPLPQWLGLSVNISSTQPWAWAAIIGITVWWCIGQNLIIYVAALGGVPQEQLEAATLDGANTWQTFTNVQLPEIRFPLFFTIVTTTIAQFNVYGQPLMFTRGGPNNSTKVLLMNIQENAFGAGIPAAGMASAMAVILGILIISISAIQFALLRKAGE